MMEQKVNLKTAIGIQFSSVTAKRNFYCMVVSIDIRLFIYLCALFNKLPLIQLIMLARIFAMVVAGVIIVYVVRWIDSMFSNWKR